MKTKSNPDYRTHLRDERSHMEGLLNQRFNFFIVIFGFIVAAIPFINNVTQLRFIFIVGFIIELLFTLLIGRAQRKLTINMDLLAKLKNEPSGKIDELANKGSKWNPFKRSVVKLMGYVMPIVITTTLLISIFFAKRIYNFFK